MRSLAPIQLNLDVSCSVKIRNEKAIALKLVLKRRASGEVALEDTLHALWRCDCLKEVWMRDFSWFFKSGEELGSFMELVKRIFMRPETVALFATIVWLVWYHRNKTRLNETSLPLG
nr:hypothetical protein CFP56_69589 [Quercus suber]